MENAKKKVCSMINGMQPVSEEDSDKDRISSLPKNVIDRILELMPVRDAGRTCVLSIKWRYIWAEHPTLVVDKTFWSHMTKKRLYENLPVDFATDIINRMFLHHMGHINKCGLDISGVRSERHCDVDLWLSILCRKGVKVLRLMNSISPPYTIPSCVLLNSNLTQLKIYRCIFKTTMSSTALYKLESLKLENLNLPSWVLVTPLLSALTLKSCRGMRHFTISAPRLVSLVLNNNDDLNLVAYLTCSDIELVYICVNKKIKHQGDGESINMTKLLGCWPKISKLSLSGSSIKYLARGIIHEEFPVISNLKCFVAFYIHFNMDQIACLLHVLQNLRLLHIFEIWLKRDVSNDLDVVNYLEGLSTMNQRMEQLRVVKIKDFTASRAELLFMKILLHSAPSLERVVVEEDENLDPIERLRISKELMRLQREFPNAEIIFGPKLIFSMRIRLCPFQGAIACP